MLRCFDLRDLSKKHLASWRFRVRDLSTLAKRASVEFIRHPPKRVHETRHNEHEPKEKLEQKIARRLPVRNDPLVTIGADIGLFFLRHDLLPLAPIYATFVPGSTVRT